MKSKPNPMKSSFAVFTASCKILYGWGEIYLRRKKEKTFPEPSICWHLRSSLMHQRWALGRRSNSVLLFLHEIRLGRGHDDAWVSVCICFLTVISSVMREAEDGSNQRDASSPPHYLLGQWGSFFMHSLQPASGVTHAATALCRDTTLLELLGSIWHFSL